MCDPFRYPWEESTAKVRIWKWSTKNSQYGREIMRSRSLGKEVTTVGLTCASNSIAYVPIL
jgi:hypothetical protein